MRGHGVIGDARSLGPRAHACWCFDDDEEYRTVVGEFLGEGLALGQRLVYVGGAPTDELHRSLAVLGDVDELIRSGTLVPDRFDALHGPTVGAVEAQRLADCRRLVDQAIADGFTGVRFAGDVTPLAAPARFHGEQVRREQVLDAFIDRHAMAALCAYDRRVIGEDAAAALACVHPLRSRSASTFGIFTFAGCMHLEGEVDAFQIEPLLSALAGAAIGSGDVVLDVGDLSFIDCAGIGAIARWVAERRHDGGRPAIVRAPHHFARLWDLLGHSPLAPLEADKGRSGSHRALAGSRP